MKWISKFEEADKAVLRVERWRLYSKRGSAGTSPSAT
jgi:hypothetical protein